MDKKNRGGRPFPLPLAKNGLDQGRPGATLAAPMVPPVLDIDATLQKAGDRAA